MVQFCALLLHRCMNVISTGLESKFSMQLTTKESKMVIEDRTKLTEHFIVTLPQLMAKVG